MRLVLLSRAGRFLAHGLGRKFTLFIGLLLTAFTVCLTTVNILTGQALIQERLRERADSMATMLAEFASTYLYADLRIDELTVILGDLLRQKGVTYAFVLDSEGALLADGADDIDRLFEPVDDPLSEEARKNGKGRTLTDDHGVHAVQPVFLGYERLGTARVGLSLEGMRDDIAAVRNQSLLLGLWFLLGSLLVSVPLVRRITHPLATLTSSAEAVSRGQLEQRIEIRTNDEIGTLATAFDRMLAQIRDNTQQIRHLAFYDSVTRLPNRVYFKELLGRSIAHTRRHGRPGAVLFLDLDRFKLINDTFGHDAGDRLLQGLAERLSLCLRDDDVVGRLGDDSLASTVARLGGDEFTILLTEIRSGHDAARIGERILRVLQEPFDLGEQSVVVGTSIGIAVFPDDGSDPDSLLKNADAAMYHAKEQGRNNLQFYSEQLSARNLERVTIERELRVALEQGDQLELYYQPQIDLRQRAIVGVEALLRWNHPERGVISPGLFVPIAEDTRLIVPVGTWVIEQACRQAHLWDETGVGPLRVSVNLSAAQLHERDFVELVAGILAETGVRPDLLELEITETMMMADPEDTVSKLIGLKHLGVQLAIDDFGTGYSSLAYLKRFPLDRLKVDQAFIRDIASDADNEAIVEAIIAMAHSLRVEVVAEGVETEQQLDFLRQRRCDLIQGFLYSQPLPVEDFLPWLLDWRRHAGGWPDPIQAIA
jgi:predicted signal transduction protein with EAL and GGDEF domain